MIDGEYSYDGEFPAGTDIQLFENQNLAVLYGASTDNEWRAMAFQTNIVQRRWERYESVVTLSDGDTLDYGMITEDGHEEQTGVDASASDDILRVDSERDETVVEWFVSVDPDDVFVGVQNPGTNTITGIQGDRNRRAESVDRLDQHGVKSDYTRTGGEFPSTALSPKPNQGLVRVDSDEDGRNPIRFGFKNGSGAERTVDMEFYGAAYHVTPVTDPDLIEDMVYGHGINRRVLTWGGWDNTSPNLPANWKDGRITLTDEDARHVLSSGGN